MFATASMLFFLHQHLLIIELKKAPALIIKDGLMNEALTWHQQPFLTSPAAQAFKNISINMVYSHALFTCWLSHTGNTEHRRRRRKRKLNKLLLGRGSILRPHVCLLSTQRRVAVMGNSVIEGDAASPEEGRGCICDVTSRVSHGRRAFFFFTAGVGNGWDRCPPLSHLCSHSGCVGSRWVILLRRLEWMRSLSSAGVRNHSVLKWGVTLPSLWLCLQMTRVGVAMSEHVK